ncbi:MAG TPA: histidine kinase dimerization/phospho-acceptor domain-containing protein [Thermoanaerobaculia bacterium]
MDLWLEHFARASFRRSADTAHDLKTPLNVAVLNLELLRMRLRKIADDGSDEKLSDYTRAIEMELRRMGRIFDAFFLMSTPPAGEGDPQPVDVAPIARELAAAVALEANSDAPAPVLGHEARIRQAVKLFFEGAAKLVTDAACSAGVRGDDRFELTVEGKPVSSDFEPTRIFKFYYTDPDGNPDLSLAVARLIAETYGGEVSAVEDRDKVSLRLSFPLGAR